MKGATMTLQALATLLTSVNPFVAILITMVLVIYIITTNNEFFNKLYDLKRKNFSKVMEYCEDILEEIEEISYGNAKRIIKEKQDDGSISHNEASLVLSNFHCALNRALFMNVKGAIKEMLHINGYYDFKDDPKKLEEYVAERGRQLLIKSRRSIANVVDDHSPLAHTDEERFTEEQAVAMYKRIINKAIEVKKKEEKEVKDLKAKYVPILKITNLFGKKS